MKHSHVSSEVEKLSLEYFYFGGNIDAIYTHKLLLSDSNNNVLLLHDVVSTRKLLVISIIIVTISIIAAMGFTITAYTVTKSPLICTVSFAGLSVDILVRIF